RDWSSDVCSSDLRPGSGGAAQLPLGLRRPGAGGGAVPGPAHGRPGLGRAGGGRGRVLLLAGLPGHQWPPVLLAGDRAAVRPRRGGAAGAVPAGRRPAGAGHAPLRRGDALGAVAGTLDGGAGLAAGGAGAVWAVPGPGLPGGRPAVAGDGRLRPGPAGLPADAVAGFAQLPLGRGAGPAGDGRGCGGAAAGRPAGAAGVLGQPVWLAGPAGTGDAALPGPALDSRPPEEVGVATAGDAARAEPGGEDRAGPAAADAEPAKRPGACRR